jgi:hypothetical protein
MAFFLMQVDGIPFPLLLFLFPFPSNHEIVLPGTGRPGLSGHTTGFMAIKIGPFGSPVGTNIGYLTVN